MNERPVFYDASGRRAAGLSWARRLLAVAVMVLVVLVGVSLFSTPSQTPLPLHQLRVAIARFGDRTMGGASFHRPERTPMRWRVPAGVRNAAAPQLSAGFYTPWADDSAASLQRNIGKLDWVVPHWLSVYGPDHAITPEADVRGPAILGTPMARRPLVLPMIQNAHEGDWDGKGLAALLADPAKRAAFEGKLTDYVATVHGNGIVFDFEEVPATAHGDLLALLREMHAAFASHGWLVGIAAPFDNSDWDYAAYARAADRVFLMAYDQHWETSGPGPIAAEPWFGSTLAARLRQVPAAKAIVCIGNYAYDWTAGAKTANELTVEEAWAQARDNDATVRWDAASRNPTYTYDDDSGKHHEVWMLDAATARNELAIARALGVNASALWRLGAEDPSLWSVWGRSAQPGLGGLSQIPAGTNVQIEGRGEILEVSSTPKPGLRTVTTDANGLIADEKFTQLPSPYVIDRGGYHPGLVALTFDDGPDPVWTPQILDVLKANHIPATFFLIGENAVAEPGLVRRLLSEGHEIGNHTYTHPNLGTTDVTTARIEIEATERAIESFTGHGMRLFRAPFFGDAEPSTVDEINPVLEAQRLGYTSVGLHVDPLDWQQPPAAQIVERTVAGVTSSDELNGGQIVLLHDAGGDRSQTVAALPEIIRQLRAKGYRFVAVSELAGLSAAQVNPVVARRLVADAAFFNILHSGGQIVKALFLFAIALGVVRALVLMAGALWDARRRRRLTVPAIDPARFVSVLIPCFNEARVIEQTVWRVLASEQTSLEVIVIDDGSKDGTADVVASAFADEPRVRLLRLVNGGKARALNQGLTLARGEVIIALDADTQFEPLTIARLARWFAEPRLGAVAGNAKVGNRVNLMTKWQALEYVTAQNLERRALSVADAITVVPGAVGAWRMAALQAVGGYPPETLAEDQDLTIAVQRAGWRVIYDQDAVAWTEAPERARGLMKQRFRWAFGTLQCLWKHRAVLVNGRPRGLAHVGLPQAWLFQIGFGLVSPLIDLGLLLSMGQLGLDVYNHGAAASHDELVRVGLYWLVFSAVDAAAAFTAFVLEPREDKRLLWLLLPQRFGYRQMMYYVVVKAVWTALRGPTVGWGKLERSARVAVRPA